MEKRGILGLKSSKNMVLIGNKAMWGGGCIGESPRGKTGGNGRKWGEMGGNVGGRRRGRCGDMISMGW